MPEKTAHCLTTRFGRNNLKSPRSLVKNPYVSARPTQSRHLRSRSESSVCLRFLDAGQCVSVVLGGQARVDKSDKVEAAGRKRRAMGKVQAPVPDIGWSFADFSEFGGVASMSWV